MTVNIALFIVGPWNNSHKYIMTLRKVLVPNTFLTLLAFLKQLLYDNIQNTIRQIYNRLSLHECQSCQQDCATCTKIKGYYWDNYRCQGCPQACVTCTSSDSCTSCSDGYYWDNYRCQRCPQGCATCTSSDICTHCLDGYYLNNYICQRCPQGCATCEWSDKCTSCKDRYYLTNYECVQCPQNCKACTFESELKKQYYEYVEN